MTSVDDPLVGRVLDGRYRIMKRLARGGMATVYQATDSRLTRTVAVKVMHVGLGDDAEFARKFDREARAAARLSHPQVVAVFDQGADDIGGLGMRPYIVMEYVEGQTLRDVIGREGAMEPQRTLDLIEPIVRAVAAAHDAGLVHRDIKPENVLISDRGQLKVADFGLAKAISAQTSTATQGMLIGTVSYLPPELVVTGKADARSDVYSLGVVLFELLTGRKPHTGETPIQVAYAHVHHDVGAPSSYATAGPIPPYLDALVARMTARSPDLRPHDARVLLSHIHRVQGALRDGLEDDPRLTADLALPSRADQLSSRDPSSELTQPVGDYRLTAASVQPASPTPVPPSPNPSSPFTGPVAASPVPTSPVTTSPVTTSPVAGSAAAAPVHWSIGPELRRVHTPRTPSVFDAGPPTRPQPAITEPLESAATPSPDRYLAHRERAVRRRRRGIVLMLLVLVLTTAAAATGWYVMEGRYTATPQLAQLTRAQAVQSAEEAGLTVAFGEDFSETVPVGAVIRTDPAAGDRVFDGSEITATLSKGPERFAMPKLTGLTEEQARMALAEANLAAGEITTRYDDKVAAGMVIKASKKAGTELRRQTPIDFVVSRGPEPIKITDFTGRSAEQAETSLRDDGFKVETTEENSETITAGLVISQTPSDGSAAKGETITLTVSLGPELITVPNVQSMPTDQATKILREAGFEVQTKPSPVNFLNLGFVAYSDPAARSKAPRGTMITLFVV